MGASLHKAWEKTNNQNLRRTRQPQRTMLLNKALGPHIPDKPFFLGDFFQGFWVFGSLSSRQKLPEPKTKKTRGKPKKTKKTKKPMSLKKVLGPDIPQNALVFLFFFGFFVFFRGFWDFGSLSSR